MTPVRRLQVRARMVVLVYLTATTLLVGQSIDVVMKPPAKLNFNSAQVSIDVATDQNTRSDALSKDFETKLGTELAGTFTGGPDSKISGSIHTTLPVVSLGYYKDITTVGGRVKFMDSPRKDLQKSLCSI